MRALLPGMVSAASRGRAAGVGRCVLRVVAAAVAATAVLTALLRARLLRHTILPAQSAVSRHVGVEGKSSHRREGDACHTSAAVFVVEKRRLACGCCGR
jgi:hypothetical protein